LEFEASSDDRLFRLLVLTPPPRQRDPVDEAVLDATVKAPRVVVCVPTYNERGNIEALLRALGDVLPAGGRVLVIDDRSPDGTGDIAEALSAELEFVHVLHRAQKEGLGPAYIAGFQWAIEREADLVVAMDCDFSHDPADVPRLLHAARSAALVIGSRYVEGGSVPDWSLLRRMISRFGSFYARNILNLDVRDLTGGFKCYHRGLLEIIDLSTIRSRGYMFQIETTLRAVVSGFTVSEIPITFADRREGASKMGGAIVLEALWRVPCLRLAGYASRRRPVPAQPGPELDRASRIDGVSAR
jgi:dolichol-phosphate mannosyltransferase